MSRTMLALPLALCLAVPAMAQQPPINLHDPAVIAAGQKLFNKNCAGYCHGKDGLVGRGPSLRGRTDLDADDIHDTITFGRRDSGKIMPSWKGQLSDQQIWELTAFIMSLRNVK